jgi:hypothetical protein
VCRVGLDFPTIEVRFEHLNVEAEACVGSRALPTILNFSINLLEVIITIGLKLDVLLSQTVLFEAKYTDKLECLCICALFLKGFVNFLHLIPNRKKPLTVLHDVSGIIKPKR